MNVGCWVKLSTDYTWFLLLFTFKNAILKLDNFRFEIFNIQINSSIKPLTYETQHY